MARSDLLLSLVKAGTSGDRALFRKTVEALIAEERAKKHDMLADRLAESLHSHGAGLGQETRLTHTAPVADLFFEVTPKRTFHDLILPALVRDACHDLVEEHHRADLLRSYNLAPRNKVLLVGPPGNGKTTLTEALAHALMVPLLIVRYEGIIASYLGETASRLHKLFDYIRTHRCVLFFDEFDTIGKERGDIHEIGEMKRVVSALLLQIDEMPSHVVVVTATNHPELLDRAVWRRFQLRLELPPPTRAQTEEYFAQATQRFCFPLGTSPRTLAEKMSGASYAELEEFLMNVARRYVLTLPNADSKAIVSQQLKQWQQRFTPQAPC